VLGALKSAKIRENADRGESSNVAPLAQHLAAAGKLLRNNDYEAAAQELDAALQPATDLKRAL